jgi:hypothetical protein
MRRVVLAVAVATFGLAVPAQALVPPGVRTVTADQCKRGGGFVYGGKCRGGTWSGQTVRG